jgi:O-antigen ligase
MVSDNWREGADGLAVAAAACALVLLLVPGACRDDARRLWLFVAGLGAFLTINLTSAVLAEELPGRGGFSWRGMHLTGILVAFAAGVGLRRRGAVERLLGWLLLLSGIWYLGETVTMPWRSAFEDGRLAGDRGYPTLLAAELVLLIALYLGNSLAWRRRLSRAASLAGAGLTGVLLFMTKGRAALLVLGAVAIPAVLLFQRRLGRTRTRIAAVCLWLLLLAPLGLVAWWCAASPERRSGTTVRSRLTIYRLCFQATANAPWYRAVIGHGPSRRVYPATVARYAGEPPRVLGQKIRHAHNNLFQIFLETGLIGVLAVTALWLIAFRSAWVAWRSDCGDSRSSALPGVLLAALVTVAANGAADYTLWHVTGRLSWLVVGLAFASGGGAAGLVMPAAPGGTGRGEPGEPGNAGNEVDAE